MISESALARTGHRSKKCAWDEMCVDPLFLLVYRIPKVSNWIWKKVLPSKERPKKRAKKEKRFARYRCSIIASETACLCRFPLDLLSFNCRCLLLEYVIWQSFVVKQLHLTDLVLFDWCNELKNLEILTTSSWPPQAWEIEPQGAFRQSFFKKEKTLKMLRQKNQRL